jgi:hypothetical protein
MSVLNALGTGWRDVLFLLSEKYPTCLMLSFAIKKMGGDVPSRAIDIFAGMDTDFDIFYSNQSTQPIWITSFIPY